MLNDGYEFVRDAPEEVRRAFQGVPMRVLLREGDTLFRLLEPGFQGTLAGFWLPLETYHALRNAEHFTARRYEAWAISCMPGRPAPLQPSTFCRATLRRDAYGFKGCARGSADMQALIARARVWVPGLDREDVMVLCYSLSEPPLD